MVFTAPFSRLSRLCFLLGLGSAAALGWFPSQASADHKGDEQPSASQIQHRLERLATVGRLLYIAAHPDDENTRLLSYLVSERKVEAAYLSITRGDGGQNLIGSEQGPLLGLIRTHELLQARQVDGALQFFTRALDFGYSKSAEETLRLWGHEAVLEDVVWVIRSFRPDVVVTRFPEVGQTHGHHLASGRLGREAYLAAADPRRFSHQLSKVKVWQAHRLVYNVAQWFQIPAKPRPGTFRMDVGGYNPLFGRSHGEIASESRSMHQSQGFGVAKQRGPLYEDFKVLAGSPATADLFEGLDLTWKRTSQGQPRFSQGSKIESLLQKALRDLRPSDPSGLLPTLVEAWKLLRQEKAQDDPLLQSKQSEIQALLQACAGLFLDARSKSARATPGFPLPIILQALHRSKADLALVSVAFASRSVSLPAPLTEPLYLAPPAVLKDPTKPAPPSSQEVLHKNKPWSKAITLLLPREAAYSGPSWLQKPGTTGAFAIPEPTFVQRPLDPSPLEVVFQIRISGETLFLRRPVRYVWTDRVYGEKARRTEIAPPITITPEAPVLLFPKGKPQTLAFEAQASAGPVKGSLRLDLPQGWKVTPSFLPLAFLKAGEVERLVFTIQAPDEKAQTTVLSPRLTMEGQVIPRPAMQEASLRYPHIPHQTIFTPATIKLVPFDVSLPTFRIGYVQGAKDLVFSSLRRLGVEVEMIPDTALLSADLSGYKAIIVGIRAFNTNRALVKSRSRLLSWVKQGGLLLVQYTTSSRWSPFKIAIGPYPLTIGQKRVSDETAPIVLLDPKHPIFRSPHPITDADFSGWVQERGLYFASRWDGRYQALLKMADPQEPPLLGSLLVGEYGRGAFLYTGLSFFRQLPAAVPGAYRLFFNLLSYRPKAHEQTKEKEKEKSPLSPP